MKLPREFFIEDRLEKHRLNAESNLGESGMRNFTVSEVLEMTETDKKDLLGISLADSPNSGREDLRKKISQLYTDIGPENILVTTGTSEALLLIFMHIIQKGYRVSFFSPAFQALYEVPLSFGALTVPVSAFSRFSAEEIFSEKAELMILNHPHNPTGRCFSKEDIKYIQKNKKKYNGSIIFDEHYRFLDYHEEIGFSGADRNRNIFATGSVTKCFGVTGLRIGWVVGNEEIIQKMRSLKDYITHTVNPVSEFLALRILEKRQNIASFLKKRVRKNLEVFQNHFQSLFSLKSANLPEGGLVFFPELKAGLKSESYSDWLLENAGVFVLPGSSFESEGFIRIGLGETEERFEKGIKKWADAEKKLASEK